MEKLVEKLADLTALRDRDMLDIALARTLSDLLQANIINICRVVGDSCNQRWLTSARWNALQEASCADSAWSKLELLPPLAAHPLRQQAATSRQITQSGHFPGHTVFPFAGNIDTIGVLEIGTDIPLTAELQRLISGVLRLYLNFQGLLDYGERDALTELLNRKTFDGAFLKATLEQQQDGNLTLENRRDISTAGSYWLAMLDIDHFKRVNDNYGHLIGDEVLLLLAQLMRDCFRFHDQLYRFGGEEFVVLMRCHDEKEAAKALERLRTTTQEHLFPQVGKITISIGFSEVKAGDTPSGAFERADKAVYYAKSHGRNQVCSYMALVNSGELQDQAQTLGDIELF